MSRVLDFEPKKVFYYFEELTKIPRGSGNEKQVSDFLKNFAIERKLDYVQDKYMNVVIRKPATPGYESLPAVILQGHMDMVNEKNAGTLHDFEKDPLKLVLKGVDIYADGTTLGADNGIAVAMALAILDSSDISHPALEAVFTVEEETGLTGAANLDGALLHGKYLINMDSEEEGELLASCAGGARTQLHIPVTKVAVSGKAAYTLSVTGLYGGHSGMDIIKGRGNANKIMGRLLSDLMTITDYELTSVQGGSKMNAIPREAFAGIVLQSQEAEKTAAFVNKWNGILKNELYGKDEGVSVKMETLNSLPAQGFDSNSKAKVIHGLMTIPNGILSMSSAMEGLVESSVNLGVVVSSENHVTLESCHRSSVGSLLDYLLAQHEALADLLGGDFEMDSRYPEWQFNPHSKLRDHFERVYKDIYGKEAKTVAIHAGVECGLFSEKVEGLDMISLGPNMADVHTPNEHLNIPSTQRTYQYILEVLKRFGEVQ